MDTDDIGITLVAASDDAPLESNAYQKELSDFVAELRAHNIRYSPQFRTMDAAGGISPGWYTGAFAIAKETLPIVLGLLVVWIQSRKGRKVRIKNREMEVEAPTVRELRKILRSVNQRKKKQVTKRASRKKS